MATIATALTSQQAHPTTRYAPEQLRVLRETRPVVADLDGAVALLDERFASIVGRPRVGRERVGLLLSGGIDSALTLALLVRAGYHPRCFTAGPADSADSRAARALAHRFGAPWTCVEPTVESVRERLEPVVRALGHWAPQSVAAGLQLDALLTAAKQAGVQDVWSGSGLGAVFGESAAMEAIGAERGTAFHDRFWARTFALIERRGAAVGPIDVHGAIASAHGLAMRMPFEGFPTARLARRIQAGLLYGESGEDRVPLRRLAERLDVPHRLAARRKAGPPPSLATLSLLARLMDEDASLWCPDEQDGSSAIVAPECGGGPGPSHADGPPSAATMLALRYFLARVAADAIPLRLMAAQVSARRRAEAPAPAPAALALPHRAPRG